MAQVVTIFVLDIFVYPAVIDPVASMPTTTGPSKAA